MAWISIGESTFPLPFKLRRFPTGVVSRLAGSKEEPIGYRQDRYLHGIGNTDKRSRFGKLRLYGTLRVGKDKVSWQELECFLFAEMLICVKEKKIAPNQWEDQNGAPRKSTRCTLKGSILIKKHLNEVAETGSKFDP